VLATWFYNIIFKMKHKLYRAQSQLPPSPPPPPFTRKHPGCAPVYKEIQHTSVWLYHRLRRRASVYASPYEYANQSPAVYHAVFRIMRLRGFCFNLGVTYHWKNGEKLTCDLRRINASKCYLAFVTDLPVNCPRQSVSTWTVPGTWGTIALRIKIRILKETLGLPSMFHQPLIRNGM
jgi:hypothetical protein